MDHRTRVKAKYAGYLTLGALGVVYGDIGTSPLYAMRECFVGPHAVEISEASVFGVLSLIFWTLLVIVCTKYLAIVMRADNRGEGGVLALMALLVPHRKLERGDHKLIIVYLGLIGTALMYGDGVITPAISVLSAVEGLKIATPLFEGYIVHITIAIMSALFLVQSKGTGSIGKVFGPIMVVWFFVIGLLGFAEAIKTPEVFVAALDPSYGASFLLREKLHGFITLSSVFLVVTGAEALYADMGHFGKLPIRIGWFLVAFPGLFLNYCGQAALLLRLKQDAVNPFYQLAPEWFLLPLVFLATAATVIASQALISGAFSITRQAVQLGYLPRMEIRHTSSREIGQIYIPRVNQFLWLTAVLLVVTFKSSSNLASAYGISVATTMVITTALIYWAAVKVWRWNVLAAGVMAGFFVVIDLLFFLANSVKILQGGWIAVLIAAVLFSIMSTWYRGRQILRDRLFSESQPLDDFVKRLDSPETIRVPGAAVFMTNTIDRVPAPLMHNLKHNKIAHSTIILVNVRTEEMPFVPNKERVVIGVLGEGVFKVSIRYGFMESPDVPSILAEYQERFSFDLQEVTYFLGRETLITSAKPSIAPWREKLFFFISTNAQRATTFFNIPPNQVIEIGVQVKL